MIGRYRARCFSVCSAAHQRAADVGNGGARPTSYTPMSSSAVYAVLLFSGTKRMSRGARASYRNGARSVSRSCVPIATSWRRRHRFWCSLSCRSMNDAYERGVNLTFRSTAAAKNGRICAVCAAPGQAGWADVCGGDDCTSGETVAVIRLLSPPGGILREYVGARPFRRKARSAREMPSMHRRS
jgi:hypothetical protein